MESDQIRSILSRRLTLLELESLASRGLTESRYRAGLVRELESQTRRCHVCGEPIQVCDEHYGGWDWES